MYSMERIFALLVTIASLGYTNGLLCPIGYTLKKDIFTVNRGSFAWSDAVTECSKRNGTIIRVNDDRFEPIVTDALEKYSIFKTWVVFTGEVNETLDESIIKKPYFVIESIPDSQFRASSQRNTFSSARRAKINSKFGWVPDPSTLDDTRPWVEVDLGEIMCIHGIVTQGRKNTDEWTKVYQLSYKKDSHADFITYYHDGKEPFLPGNDDRNTPVYRNFTKPFDARIVRLYPICWHNIPALRFDLLISDNKCPPDNSCGECAAMLYTRGGNLTIEYVPCCSQLPYLCETELCLQIQKETTAGRETFLIDSRATALLIVGLTITLIFLVILSAILLTLLILFHRSQRFRNPTFEKLSNRYQIYHNEREMDETATQPGPNSDMKKESTNVYGQIDRKSKTSTNSGVQHVNTAIDDVALYDDPDPIAKPDPNSGMKTDVYSQVDRKSKASANSGVQYVKRVIDDVAFYDTPEDAIVDSSDERNGNVYANLGPDGIEMCPNDLYSDAA